MKTKFFALFLAVIVVLSLAGCTMDAGKSDTTSAASKPAHTAEKNVDAETPVLDFDILGSYNGVGFSGMADSWDSTFGADEWEFWEFANQDYEHSIAAATNSSYDRATLGIIPRNRFDSNPTRDDILNDGMYGYTVDCSEMKIDARPPMTWKGFTFGASVSDVTSAYGEPDYLYEGSAYNVYTYYIDIDFNGHKDFELTFYVYFEGGMQRADLSHFGTIE